MPDANNQPNGAPFGADEGTHAKGSPLEGHRWLWPVIENSSESVTIVDVDGTLRYASPAFGRMLGYDPEEVVGRMNVLEHVHPEDLPHVLEETKKALTARGVATNKAEYRFRHKDGSWRWVESIGTYLLEDPYVGVVVQTRDVTERKETEQELRESERRFSGVLSKAHAYVYRCLNEPGYPNEYASDYALELTGFPPEELLVGGSVRYGDLLVEEDRDRVWEEVQKALGERRGFELRYAIRRKDGEVRHVLEHGQGVYDEEDGRLVALEGMVHDVTSLIEAEEALKESEERYRTLVERVPAITCVHHHKPGGFSGTTFVSPQVESVLGYTEEEYSSDPEFWKTILHPEDRDRVLAEDQRTSLTWEPFDLDYRMITKDRSVVWVRESGTFVRVEDDETQVWHSVMFDITNLKRVELELRGAEERYRTLVERVPAIIYIQRPREGPTVAYDTTYISPRLEEVLGYPPERFVEDPAFWDRVIHPEDRERVLAEDERTDRTGEPFSMEYRIIAEDGRVVWVKDEATLVQGDSEEPLYWLGVQLDVTDRKYWEEALRDAEERYRTLIEQIPAVTYIDPVDDPDASIYTSPHIEEMLGYTPEEWISEGLWPKRLHPEDRERVLAVDERFEAGLEERFSEDYRLIAKDGSVVWVHEEAVVLRDQAGEPLFWQGVIFDVTERKQAEEELKKSEERLRSLVDSAFEGILIADEGEILEANRALVDMIGYELSEIVGSSALEFVAPEHRDLVRRKIASGAEEPYEIVGVKKDGTFLDLEVRGRAFSYRGRDVRVTAVRDVTERKAFERRLRQQALRDSLTGLPNRKLFIDRLAHALERTRRTSGRKVAVLFMDLDGFKVVNDSLGHEVGDLLLVMVTERLRTCLRPEDTLARFGGDEFVVLLEDVETTTDLIGVAGRIAEELRKPLVTEGKNLFASASIGIALGDARTKTPQDLLRDADTAMYRAKEEHANYRVFDPSMYERAVGRLELESDLRRAIEAKEFAVHYQPIVSLESGETWGLEALVRWDHPERGLLDPSQFVPLAEESGLVVPIGERVFEEACRQAQFWQENSSRTTPLMVSVNLSAVQLRRSDLAHTVAEVLHKTGLDPSCLSLDVTETAYVSIIEESSAALNQLKSLGVGVSIDDFGVGHSSLSYLKRLPADVLKIDRSFVRGLGEKTEDKAIVRMVIELAHTLGMKVVAEGVEEGKQAALLAQMDCDLAQGYYFSRPLPPEEVPTLLAKEAFGA